jgi:hypothetical protein
MGAVYAVQVRTGSEIKAKEMLKRVLSNANDQFVEKIFALETKTLLGNNLVDTSDVVTEEDIRNHLVKEELNSYVTNKRTQLEAIERYNDESYEQVKEDYKQSINSVQKELVKYRKKPKVSSVLNGYILIELKETLEMIPNSLIGLITSVPYISRVLNQAIPEYEVNSFFESVENQTMAQAEINFGQEVDYETYDQMEKEALQEVNLKDTTEEKKKKLFDQLDDYRENILDKVKKVLKKKKEKQPMLQTVNAFIKRKRVIIHIPIALLKQLYVNDELQFLKGRIKSKDFLHRLERFASMDERMSMT